jgi:NAD(P)-dependent dehydrogenase (short-subunit alcohol dehydrogenase family)
MGQPVAETTSPLHGRRVLVAGGDGEIGRVISAGLAADGADVAITSIDGDSAATFAESLFDGRNRTVGYRSDITDRDSIDGVVDTITTLWGGIDVLVNCVGILKVSTAEDFDPAEWRAVIETNLTGAFLLSQAVGRVMIKNGTGGRIVHLSSVRGTVGLAVGGFTAYGASKAGLHLLVKQLAAEWGKYQISVNAVAAGFVRTALSAAALEDKGFQNLIAARTPLGRVAEIQEIANATRFLASPRSEFITGQILFVDGGLTATQ